MKLKHVNTNIKQKMETHILRWWWKIYYQVKLRLLPFTTFQGPSFWFICLLPRGHPVRAHKVRQQVNGPHNAPFAQCLDLGWVVIGEVCLGNVHKPTVNTFKTNVLDSGRHSIIQPCTSFMHVKETPHSLNRSGTAPESMLGQTVFNRTENDNKPAQWKTPSSWR